MEIPQEVKMEMEIVLTSSMGELRRLAVRFDIPISKRPVEDIILDIARKRVEMREVRKRFMELRDAKTY